MGCRVLDLKDRGVLQFRGWCLGIFGLAVYGLG